MDASPAINYPAINHPAIRLKSDVTLRPLGARHFLGLPHRGIFIDDPLHLMIARQLDGSQSAGHIATGLKCERSAVDSFIGVLMESELIDFLDPLKEGERKSSPKDFNQQYIATRKAPELALASHRPGNFDGGNFEFDNRAQATILISGENRLARNLLIALHASGFTQTRLIPRARLSRRIEPDDVCGIVVQSADIGRSRDEFMKEVIRNSQITKGAGLETVSPEGSNALAYVAKSKPDLIISTVAIEWDYVQRWQSEGTRYLHLNTLIGGTLEVGPFVIPGQSPCLRCVTLTKRENGIDTQMEFIRKEVPTAVAIYMAGLLTLAVSQYFATGNCDLIASSLWYDMHNPMRAAEQRYWSFHSSCGCR